MTTYYQFTPSNLTPPSFQPTLDGSVYTCYVNWNMYAQRYYLICFDTNNDVVFNVALVTSPAALTLENISWSAATLLVTATTNIPHGFVLGSVLNLTIDGATPSGYNGNYNCSVTSATTFTYPLSTDPGLIVSPGSASWQVNLCEGYFTTSSIVYRNNQFEISP